MELVNHLTDRLLFAIPKKGRLYQKSVEILNGSDIKFHRSQRLDIALSTNLPVALIFLPAADIPMFVGEGKCDLGITGVDQVREANIDVDLPIDLKFGSCKLQVQVPNNGEYTKPEQLVGKTIVSTFTNLTKKYFAKLEGVPESQMTTKVKYVGGSVEASCALGVADAIVDLVESGETMRAAGLIDIATVLDTSAHLIQSKYPKGDAELIETIKSRIEGVMTAQRYVYCTYNAAKVSLPSLLAITPGRKAPTLTNVGDDGEWVAVAAMIEKNKKGAIMDELKKNGATDIIVFDISNCRV
ncbi:similar to Saccharomyces cerevisiae YER055C HIS1 ATP phosphoribosyltransferase, a hexameric enzyme, catalyzes the first step in histidine biosynthesis [Maudiozyma barnettii]|uniref:ATP phosphoribosyltransferase n=1 Tax=Maudiozyma barnettii TaxID=61262 RepID=A0A8H2ZHK1_9SACH|nr:ATP phosphoribosyltransferase [Kazachstania barnettii]CAB4254028.1 similar to Saccharomyces cerevisiae YER055C HIS1 ATP phosphoribosyltransferase, a hexameric enzyme, catalyzes the first step in histidine biosynthesis [Kazachstania barnettii]CAD1781778.1 similar to Saccharomyces cerevisiae YER055C HIS1 ATP phosphoribosyltransferase, a hexameric enzyme, catalyzes the first step in histidine biosynthesis [Kazachstania barnettii]